MLLKHDYRNFEASKVNQKFMRQTATTIFIIIMDRKNCSVVPAHLDRRGGKTGPLIGAPTHTGRGV